MCNRYIFKKNTTVCVPHIIEQTQFLSTRFLGSKFKSENIYFGVNFCGKNVCGNFYLRELVLRIAGKIAKIRTRKNLVRHGMSYANKYGNDVNLTTEQLSLQSY